MRRLVIRFGLEIPLVTAFSENAMSRNRFSDPNGAKRLLAPLSQRRGEASSMESRSIGHFLT